MISVSEHEKMIKTEQDKYKKKLSIILQENSDLKSEIITLKTTYKHLESDKSHVIEQIRVIEFENKQKTRELQDLLQES